MRDIYLKVVIVMSKKSVIALVIVFVLLLGAVLFFVASSVKERMTASQDAWQTFDAIAVAEQAKPYIRVENDTEHSSIDLEMARSAGETQETLRAFTLMNQMAEYADTDHAGLKLPEWGEWCGPSKSGPDSPIDLLDQACHKHDLCYAKGEQKVTCDKALILDLERDNERMAEDAQKTAQFIRSSFAVLTTGR